MGIFSGITEAFNTVSKAFSSMYESVHDVFYTPSKRDREDEFVSVGRTDKAYEEWVVSTGLISDGALGFASDYMDLFNLADS